MLRISKSSVGPLLWGRASSAQHPSESTCMLWLQMVVAGGQMMSRPRGLRPCHHNNVCGTYKHAQPWHTTLAGMQEHAVLEGLGGISPAVRLSCHNLG